MRSLLVLTVVTACGGGPPVVDAKLADAPPADASADANLGPPCTTTETYDPCVGEHDCTSGLCYDFVAEGFRVCTESCDGTTPVDRNGDA